MTRLFSAYYIRLKAGSLFVKCSCGIDLASLYDVLTDKTGAEGSDYDGRRSKFAACSEQLA